MGHPDISPLTNMVTALTLTSYSWALTDPQPLPRRYRRLLISKYADIISRALRTQKNMSAQSAPDQTSMQSGSPSHVFRDSKRVFRKTASGIHVELGCLDGFDERTIEDR